MGPRESLSCLSVDFLHPETSGLYGGSDAIGSENVKKTLLSCQYFSTAAEGLVTENSWLLTRPEIAPSIFTTKSANDWKLGNI